VTPWDVTSEQLAKELEAYTLEEIGRNMADSDAAEPKPPPTSQSQGAQSAPLRIKKGTSSKFKPKVPAQRYRDRHPETAAPPVVKEADPEQTDDDGDFVIDTYVRMPAEDVPVGEKNHIGYIVLEDQPDIDEFYEDEDMENEDDEEYDEDDENGEYFPWDYNLPNANTDNPKLRTITPRTTQMRRSTLTMSTIVTPIVIAPVMRQTRRNSMRTIMMRWTRKMILIRDTLGFNRASPPG
jgi:hypothetical protein